jgi:hypothetical protein
LKNDLLCCSLCGSIILDTRKDAHDEFHSEIDQTKEKLKPKEDYNEG